MRAIVGVSLLAVASFQGCRANRGAGELMTGGRTAPQSDGAGPRTGPPPGWQLTSVPAADGLPPDASPNDVSLVNARIILSSYTLGLFEVEWPDGAPGPTILQQWPRASIGIVGEARYGADSIYANVSSKGLAKIVGKSVTLFGQADGLINNELLTILVRANGEIWVAGVPTPFGGGGVQILANGTSVRTIALANTDLQTLRDWIEMPDRGSVFAATKAGVVEIKSDGTSFVVDRNSVSAIARQSVGTATTPSVGAVGDFVERWDGTTFAPMGGHRPAPAGGSVSSGPVDLVIQSDGTWVILYADGFLSVLDPTGHYQGGFDNTTGVPPSAQRLLLLADGKRVLLGGPKGSAILTRS